MEIYLKEAEKLAQEKKENRKEEYIQKLDDIEYGLSDLDYLYETRVTIDIKEANSKKYTRWDNALNEIYSVLEGQLSSSDMDDLRRKQIEWI